MKLIANIKLEPTPEQYKALKSTLRKANACCNWISAQAWKSRCFGNYALHGITYHEAKSEFGLSAQVVVRSIAKVCNTYRTNKKVQHVFKEFSAQPFDKRIFRLMKGNNISIWTVVGRQQIPFVCGEYQRKLLEQVTESEVDLMFIRGHFYIGAVCEVTDDDLINPEDVLGIDLGVVNLAVDSNGITYSGSKIEDYRRKFTHRRKNLQKKGTKSAKRKLKQISGKQARFQKDQNHCVSKAIVNEAQRLHSAIAIEDLTGIRNAKARKSQRARLANWAFYQMRQYILYKSHLRGIPVVLVDPAYTSQECPECHHVEKTNRKNRNDFKCVSCGHSQPADHVAARNIRARAVVKLPMVANHFRCLATSS